MGGGALFLFWSVGFKQGKENENMGGGVTHGLPVGGAILPLVGGAIPPSLGGWGDPSLAVFRWGLPSFPLLL
jgi:hypothetical protein